MRILLYLSVGMVLALPLSAGEYVVLGNGFRLHAERHEVEGSVVRIFEKGGVTEMASGSVAGYEAEDVVEPAGAVLPPVIAPAAPAKTVPATPTSPRDLAENAAKKYALPASFVQSVMRVESGFNPAALSPKGATGLMQLMPATARALGVDVNNPAENAEGGAQYLRDLLARYENSPDQVLLALAAYNAGPGAVERYHGVPPYRETREYILRVLKNWDLTAKH